MQPLNMYIEELLLIYYKYLTTSKLYREREKILSSAS